MTTFWMIEADQTHLRDAGDQVGLDMNAFVLQDRDSEIPNGRVRLAYPSFFCPEPGPWMQVLATLVVKGLPVELWMEQSEDGVQVATARLYPKFDEDMLAMLRMLAPGFTGEVEVTAARIEELFVRLRADYMTSPKAPRERRNQKWPSVAIKSAASE